MKNKFFAMLLILVCLLELAIPSFAANNEIYQENDVVVRPVMAAASSLDHFKKTKTYQSGLFTDVSDADWFAGNVQTAYEYGLMTGSGTNFLPKDNITTAQVLVIACRLHSIYQTGTADFEQGSPWYQPYVDYAAKNGFISSDQNQNYNAAATRHAVAEILAKTMPDILTEKNTVVDGAIPDVTAGSAGYSEIYALYRAGIVSGSGEDHSFKPDTQISRAETAAMITRMINVSPRLELSLTEAAAPTPTPQEDTNPFPVDPLWKEKTNSGAVPALDAQATDENIYALLDAYDPDGAFILRKSGGDLAFWFSDGTLLKGIETAVHEQCHVLSYTAAPKTLFPAGMSLESLANLGSQREAYYAGNGIIIPVAETKIFPSNEMIQIIPEELRNTARFNTYINTSEKLSSVTDGIYGLMNEYTAYSWGMNNTISLYDYYKTYAKTTDDWHQYIVDGANGRMAYAEFRYYILTYMLYAKEHYPDIYQSIVKNLELKRAFRVVDNLYTDNVRKYEDSLTDLSQRLSKDGYEVTIGEDSVSFGQSPSNSSDDQDFFSGFGDFDDFFDGDFDFGNGGFSFGGSSAFTSQSISIFTKDYQKLMNAMSADNYQAELAVLKG